MLLTLRLLYQVIHNGSVYALGSYDYCQQVIEDAIDHEQYECREFEIKRFKTEKSVTYEK